MDNDEALWLELTTHGELLDLYNSLKITNSFLGKNNVKLMESVVNLKSALITAIAILVSLNNDRDFTIDHPEPKAEILEFLAIEEVTMMIPFLPNSIDR